MHISTTRCTSHDWREYALKVKEDNYRLYRALNGMTESRDRERQGASNLRAQNAAVCRRNHDLLSRLTSCDQRYSRLQTEYQRQSERLINSTKSENLAWQSFSQLRELFVGRGEIVLDPDNIHSLKKCIVNLVIKGEHREAEMGVLRKQLNIQNLPRTSAINDQGTPSLTEGSTLADTEDDEAASLESHDHP